MSRCLDVRVGMAKKWADELDSRGFGDTGDQAVCLRCVLDETLRERLRPHLSEDRCTFCGATGDGDGRAVAADFEQLMYIVMDAVHFLYTTAEAGLPWDSEDKEYIGGLILDSGDVAEDLCSGAVVDDVVVAIGEAITEQQWTESDIASARPDQVLGWAWEAFCRKVKHESRFVFLSTAEEVSDHPDDMTTTQLLQRLEEIIVNHKMLLKVPAGREFWRGRLTDDSSKIGEFRTAGALGAPPQDRASNSRMSPAGISMFYGSDDIDTVVAEIGAHSTDRYAIVGAFKTVRDLTLLNLADLPPVPSPFHEAGRASYFDLVFVHDFARDLGKPITLDGREHIEYVPTQVVTEYLRYVMPQSVDGILFRSAQNGGVNCVIFCDARGCVDPGKPPRGPFPALHEPYLELQPQSVQWVRILSTVAAR
jgi:hypothetical protein